MIRGRFSYDAEGHIYRVGNWVVPGTSEILEAAGYLDRLQRASLASRARGDLVHQVTAALDLGLVGGNALRESPVRGWLVAYATFRASTVLAYDRVEMPVCNRRLGFATVIDRAGRWAGRRFVLNLKTGQPDPAHAIQRALETLALDGARSRRRRLTLYLKSTGTFRVEEHTKAGDFDRAEEAITLWRLHAHDPHTHYPLSAVRPLTGSRFPSR